MFDYINQGLRDAAEKKASTAHNALQMADAEIKRLREVVEAAAAIDAVGHDKGCRDRLAAFARKALGHNVELTGSGKRSLHESSDRRERG